MQNIQSLYKIRCVDIDYDTVMYNNVSLKGVILMHLSIKSTFLYCSKILNARLAPFIEVNDLNTSSTHG